MTYPKDFPGPAQTEFFQNLGLLMLVESTPGTFELGGSVNRMSAEALIGFGDVLMALLAYAVHPGSLLSDTSSRRSLRLQ
jgi:hypothetical protein